VSLLPRIDLDTPRVPFDLPVCYGSDAMYFKTKK